MGNSSVALVEEVFRVLEVRVVHQPILIPESLTSGSGDHAWRLSSGLLARESLTKESITLPVKLHFRFTAVFAALGQSLKVQIVLDI